MKKVRVLHTLDALNYGGVETFIHNLHKNISDNISFDVLVRHSQNESKKRFEQNGGKVIVSPNFPENIIKHTKFVENFFNQNITNYDVIHIHANSLVYTLPFILLKKMEVENKPKIILHSHNSYSYSGLVRRVHYFNKKKFAKMADLRIGCSQFANEWMFGSLENEVIYNSFNVADFKYDSAKRLKIRNEFGIEEDEILLGSIGRLTEQKNYDNLLKLFSRLVKRNNKSKLILIGDGKLEKKLKNLAKDLQILDRVIFAGKRSDIPHLLSGLDIYLQPSKYEGFSYTVAEAQIANLPVLISENVPDEVIISPHTEKIKLSDTNMWIDTIEKHSIIKNNRNDYDKIDFKKFDIKKISKQLEKIYINII